MQHIEFFHRDHFEFRYHRKKAKPGLSRFIDFFWETDFDPLYERYPKGFSDALFPNVGYTYLINLGTPFIVQLEERSFEMRADGFLPRHGNMVCHHAKGNRIFGIKFRVSPVVFEKKINFSEYSDYIFPLSYLMEPNVLAAMKSAAHFNERMEIASAYYEKIIGQYAGSMRQVEIVTSILSGADALQFGKPVEILAEEYGVSPRTLQRYFEATTGISGKQALQTLRIRKAVDALASDAPAFHFSDYGYYDHSHFYKHLRQFLGSRHISIVQPHLQLLAQRITK